MLVVFFELRGNVVVVGSVVININVMIDFLKVIFLIVVLNVVNDLINVII